MNVSAKVARNSLWLIAQPFILNVVSLFAIAFVVRALGKSDYGKLTLALSFIAMFLPLANMGLRAVTVRAIAQDRERASSFTHKVLASRALLAIVTVAVVALCVNLMAYEPRTRLVVYIISGTILTQAVSSTLQDVFQGFERMSYVAYSQFIGGVLVPLGSVAMVFAGYALLAVSTVYLAASTLTMVVAWRLAVRVVGTIEFEFDLAFFKDSLSRAAPFFWPTIVTVMGAKAGTIILSLLADDASVGLYGAANSLVERLAIIPDGICTAIYPTMVVLHRESPRECMRLFRRFFEYLMMLGLPIALGAALLARPIMLLVFGSSYVVAAPVLSILAAGLCVNFLTSIQWWTLGVIHEERRYAMVSVIATSSYVVANLILVPLLREQGTAWANLAGAAATLFVLSCLIKKLYVRETIKWSRLLRILLANVLMAALVRLMQESNLAITVAVGGATYGAALLLLGVVTLDELKRARALIMRRHEPAR